jgi:dephospho-CoA kinase
MQNDLPPLVGVTGGIGSGKSAVCRAFAALGRTVLSADEIARDLTENDPGVRREIQKTFGAGIYDGLGLRRKELAAVVFAKPALRKTLDRIVHPRVFGLLKDRAVALPPDNRHPYVLVEAALVFESGMDAMLDATLLVRASEENRLSRVVARDGLTPDQVRLRFDAQAPPHRSAEKADYIIENDGPRGALTGKVEFLDRLLTLVFSGRSPGHSA